MANILTYNHLLIAELAVFAAILALTLRKPEVITTKSGNTVERPRSRMGVICILVVIAVTWAFSFPLSSKKAKTLSPFWKNFLTPSGPSSPK